MSVFYEESLTLDPSLLAHELELFQYSIHPLLHVKAILLEVFNPRPKRGDFIVIPSLLPYELHDHVIKTVLRDEVLVSHGLYLVGWL